MGWFPFLGNWITKGKHLGVYDLRYMFIKDLNKDLVDRQKKEGGQALLLVVVALSVALAVGVSTALRTLSSVSRVTTTDTAVRVRAVAEGGLEHFLSYSEEQLHNLTSSCTTNDYATANPACVVNFSPIATDPVTSHAVVKVEEFFGDSQDAYRYRVQVSKEDFTTVNLEGFTGNLNLCWLGDSDLFFNYFDGDNISNWELGGSLSGKNQGILCAKDATGGCFSGSSNVYGVTNVTSVPSACSSLGSNFRGYTFVIPSHSSTGTLQKGLAVSPLNSSAFLVFQATQGGAAVPFPNSVGYRITSKGELLENSKITTTKLVSAVKSHPFLSPNLFFGLFAEGGFVSSGEHMEVTP